MFSETQYFRQRWLWVLIIGLFLIPSVLSFLDGNYGDVAVLGTIFVMIAGVLYFVVRLEVRVEDEGVRYRFFPAHLSERTIEFDEIDRFSAGDYSPLREFGGWGMRWRPGRIAFSVSGDKCARFEREGKVDIVLGTQKPKEFEEAVRERL